MLDWFLHHMLTLWIEFGNFPLTSVTLALKIISLCLSYANSCVNPLIYAFVSNQFRKDFKSVCPCRKVSRAIVNVRRRSRIFVAAVQQRANRKDSSENSTSEKKGTLSKSKLENELNLNDYGNSSDTAMTNLTQDFTKNHTHHSETCQKADAKTMKSAEDDKEDVKFSRRSSEAEPLPVHCSPGKDSNLILDNASCQLISCLKPPQPGVFPSNLFAKSSVSQQFLNVMESESLVNSEQSFL